MTVHRTLDPMSRVNLEEAVLSSTLPPSKYILAARRSYTVTHSWCHTLLSDRTMVNKRRPLLRGVTKDCGCKMCTAATDADTTIVHCEMERAVCNLGELMVAVHEDDNKVRAGGGCCFVVAESIQKAMPPESSSCCPRFECIAAV
jgi:hypothetical protein